MKKIMLILLACLLCVSTFDKTLIQAEEEFVNTYQDVEEDVPTSTFEDEVEVTTSAN